MAEGPALPQGPRAAGAVGRLRGVGGVCGATDRQRSAACLVTVDQLAGKNNPKLFFADPFIAKNAQEFFTRRQRLAPPARGVTLAAPAAPPDSGCTGGKPRPCGSAPSGAARPWPACARAAPWPPPARPASGQGASSRPVSCRRRSRPRPTTLKNPCSRSIEGATASVISSSCVTVTGRPLQCRPKRRQPVATPGLGPISWLPR
jgi:hypothetical protein